MSARDGSRLAALPDAGHRPTPRLAVDGAPQVTFSPETPGPAQVFDFSTWPVTAELQLALARAFAFRTRPGGPIRAAATAGSGFRLLRAFARHLAASGRPPRNPSDLVPAHLRSWVMARSDHKGLSAGLAALKCFLRRIPGITAEFAACLAERNPPPPPSMVSSYSRDELARILAAARRDVRQAAQRIRTGRALLGRWRAGELGEEPRDVLRRGRLLDLIDRDADVPRYRNAQPVNWVKAIGPLDEHFAMLHLTVDDIAAFVVLLVGLTGQNRATILHAPAGHHRADGYAGGPATAVVELDKPRRGRHRHMDFALVDLPDWVPTPTDPGEQTRDDLRTPFGAYMLLHDLAGPARQRMGSDKLIAWWACRGGGVGQGFRTGLTAVHVAKWTRRHSLLADPPADGSPPAPLQVTLQRLRLTFNELHQRPVAHTEQTLANEYLARNRGNLGEYQRVVAAALAQEVAKAKTHATIRALSAAEVAEAREHPARVAARHGMDAATLQRLLTGQLDTVLGGCIDNTGGPHNPGQPCRASFMLCLGCPCARATPQHLPAQVLVHDELAARRAAMTPLRWTQRFAGPHAQLADLLDRAGLTAVADARTAITAADRALVDRFLRRELDLQ
jgi:hypothetical protein